MSCGAMGWIDARNAHWSGTAADRRRRTRCSRFRGVLLQRQRDQVAEAALGHRVLVGKQAVVGRQLQLPSARAGVADDGRAQAAGIASRHPPSEKHPGVRALAGARNLQRRRHAQLVTGLDERTGILSPLGLVEIDCQEIAGVVLQQRIDADRVLAGQVVVDHRIRQRDQRAVAAVPALDARLLADTGPPLVGAGRRVARLARGLALPADRVDIGAAAEQPAKQCHLLVRWTEACDWFRLSGDTRSVRGCRRRCHVDAVRLQQRHQPRVLGLQACVRPSRSAIGPMLGRATASMSSPTP